MDACIIQMYDCLNVHFRSHRRPSYSPALRRYCQQFPRPQRSIAPEILLRNYSQYFYFNFEILTSSIFKADRITVS
jgi:inhibitor of KinA sporulation pathway (predicted exonuclease)